MTEIILSRSLNSNRAAMRCEKENVGFIPSSALVLHVARLGVIAAAVGCTAQAVAQVPIIQPVAPGEPVRRISAQEAADLARIQHSAADVKFMQGMIMHHAQALELTELVDNPSEVTRDRFDALTETWSALADRLR